MFQRIGLEHVPHHHKCRDVENRAERPEKNHEAADVVGIPAQRLAHQFGVHVVKRNGTLRHVVQQVLHQQLQRQHRQERQKHARDQHRKHIAKVRAGRHADVFQHVAEGLAAFDHAFFQHHQAAFEQDDVGRFLGDVDGGIDRNADVGGPQRRCIVDAVAHEADDVAVGAQAAHDALFVQRRELGKNRVLLHGQRQRLVVHAVDLRAQHQTFDS